MDKQKLLMLGAGGLVLFAIVTIFGKKKPSEAVAASGAVIADDKGADNEAK